MKHEIKHCFLTVARFIIGFAPIIAPALHAEPLGKGVFARFNLKDRGRIPNLNPNDYALARQNTNVSGALGWFNWSELEPAEGATNFAVIDSFAQPWLADGKKLAIGITTSPGEVPAWVYAAGAASVTGESPASRVYPVYWDAVYQQKFGAFLQRLAQRYANDPNLELFVMGGFGEGITEHPVDNDSGTERAYTEAQWQAAGACDGLTAQECANWPTIPHGRYVQAILGVRALFRAAFPTNILLTRVHELGEPVLSPFEAALRADSVVNGYALANDGANSNVEPTSRASLRALSQSIKVGWISFTGRDKKPRDLAALGQTTGGALASRTYYVKYTWVIDGVGESTPSSRTNLTVAAGQLLTVTPPPFATEIDRANVYVGFSANGTYYLQGTVTLDGGMWTEPPGGVATDTASPPTTNTAFGSVLDLYQHLAGLDADDKLGDSAHISYVFRDIETLIKSTPGTTTHPAGDPEKFATGLVWLHEHLWPAPVPVLTPAGGLPASFTLQWPAISGFTYQVQFSADLVNWTSTGLLVPVFTNSLSWVDDGAETGAPPSQVARRFYRVQLPP
ncbi:MAG: beta-galactosidase [Verrucomicrobiales bacterium]|nr:beta-galactosidase [Verrucomicrobiales bacterium]